MHKDRITYVRYPDHVRVAVVLDPCTNDGLFNTDLARMVIHDKILLPTTADDEYKADEVGGRILHSAKYERMPEDDAIDFQHSTSQARLSNAITELVELKQRLGILARNNMLPRNEICSE